jgi:hypothetical protein
MRRIAKLAAAIAVALPIMGFASAGTAQARDGVSFSVTVGTENVRYGNDHYRDRYRPLPPRVVRRHLSAYYHEVSRLERRGDVYVARAEDDRGRALRITADAYTGRVIDVRYIRRDRDRWRDRHERWDDRDDRGHDRDYDRRDRHRDRSDRDYHH